MKFRYRGSEKKLSFGPYPQVSLRDARKMRDEARDLLGEGKDPVLEKQREKLRGEALAENTFTSIANEYCRKRRYDGDRAWAPFTAARCEYILSLLDNSIGGMPIHEIEPIDALAAIRKIEKRGKLESERRTLQLAGAVFRYAVATARLKSDPTRDLRGALMMPTATHYGAVTEVEEVGKLPRAIDDYEGQGMTKWALQLAPHVFVRPGELRHARWDEIDLDAGRVDDTRREDEDARAASRSAIEPVDRYPAGDQVDHRGERLCLPVDAVPNATDNRRRLLALSNLKMNG